MAEFIHSWQPTWPWWNWPVDHRLTPTLPTRLDVSFYCCCCCSDSECCCCCRCCCNVSHCVGVRHSNHFAPLLRKRTSIDWRHNRVGANTVDRQADRNRGSGSLPSSEKGGWLKSLFFRCVFASLAVDNRPWRTSRILQSSEREKEIHQWFFGFFIWIFFVSLFSSAVDVTWNRFEIGVDRESLSTAPGPEFLAHVNITRGGKEKKENEQENWYL